MTIADEPGEGQEPTRRRGASADDPFGQELPEHDPPAPEGLDSPTAENRDDPTADPSEPLDYDARFADIVARWSEATTSTAANAPVTDVARTDAPRIEAPRIDAPRTDASGTDASAIGSPVSDPTRAPDPSAPRAVPFPRPTGEIGDAPDGRSGVNPPLSSARPPVPWRQHTPAPEPDEDFTPAPPAPLPHGDLGFWGALLGVTLGPLWLIYLVVTNPYGSRLEMGLALVMAVGGFALIVARLPRRRDEDDLDDDGAVV